MEPPWIVALKFCSQYLSHMTKMAAMTIYGKNPSKLLLQNLWAVFHETWYGLQPIIVCSNDDPGMTLTYFTTWSILETSRHVLTFSNLLYLPNVVGGLTSGYSVYRDDGQTDAKDGWTHGHQRWTD